jgi:hypothetical protein
MPFNLSRCRRVDHGAIAPNRIPNLPSQDIRLDCAVTVHIRELHQSYTYAGLLCGTPRANEIPGDIDRAVRKVSTLFPDMPPEKIAVLPPVISFGTTTVKRPTSSELSQWPWEKLPDVTTIALLMEAHGNGYVLALWWQDGIGFPPPDIVGQIRAMPWERHVVEPEF